MVVLNSDIQIKDFRFSGVKEVRINRSIHSYMDKATIVIPSIAMVRKAGKTPKQVITADQFHEGDPVTIRLGYDGVLRTEFQGFVTRKGIGMPLELTCEGYSRQLRLNGNHTKKYATTTVKELLQLAVQGTDITLEVQDDIPMADVHLINATGADICDFIKKECEETVTIFFKDAKTLWAGLVYTPYAKNTDVLNAGKVKYVLGYNCIRDNSLKQRDVLENPIQVLFGHKLPTGETTFTSSQLKAAACKLKRILKHIPSQEWLQKFAQEKEYHENYTGYEGKLTGFLQPYAAPGYVAVINDNRYPALDGSYIVESTEVTFGTSGARRICEIGPKVGFAAQS